MYEYYKLVCRWFQASSLIRYHHILDHIEKILGHRRKRNGDYTYLVKWKGYSYEESTWEPKSNFKSHTLKAYHDQRKAERAQQSDSSSEEDDEVSHGGQQKAQ